MTRESSLSRAQDLMQKDSLDNTRVFQITAMGRPAQARFPWWAPHQPFQRDAAAWTGNEHLILGDQHETPSQQPRGTMATTKRPQSKRHVWLLGKQ